MKNYKWIIGNSTPIWWKTLLVSHHWFISQISLHVNKILLLRNTSTWWHLSKNILQTWKAFLFQRQDQSIKAKWNSVPWFDQNSIHLLPLFNFLNLSVNNIFFCLQFTLFVLHIYLVMAHPICENQLSVYENW